MKKIEREKIIAKIQEYVSQNAAKIAALYIFGSFTKNETVVNDIDILLLPAKDVDQEELYACVLKDLKQLVTDFKIDLLLFNLKEVDPRILHQAITEGIAFVNDKDYLGSKIDELSFILRQREYLYRQTKKYLMELLNA